MNPSSISFVGNPNIGKSVPFHRLTGACFNVPNYPGATVEITRAFSRFDASAELIDTLALSARLRRYLIEVIPLFLFGTLIMFLLNQFGALPAIIRAGEPLVSGWLGLSKKASAAFVMGFLRRDFGATGLFALSHQLSPCSYPASPA